MKQCTDVMRSYNYKWMYSKRGNSSAIQKKMCAVLHNIILWKDRFAEAPYLLESADIWRKWSGCYKKMAALTMYLKQSLSYMKHTGEGADWKSSGFVGRQNFVSLLVRERHHLPASHPNSGEDIIGRCRVNQALASCGNWSSQEWNFSPWLWQFEEFPLPPFL